MIAPMYRRGAEVLYINGTKLTYNKVTCKTSPGAVPTNFTCSLVGVAKRTLDSSGSQIKIHMQK